MLIKTYSVKPHCVSRWTIYIYIYIFQCTFLFFPIRATFLPSQPPWFDEENYNRRLTPWFMIFLDKLIFAVFFGRRMLFTGLVWIINSKAISWAGHLECMGENRRTCRDLVSVFAGKKPLRRPRNRLENNIKMWLWKIRAGRMNWLQMSHDRGKWKVFMKTLSKIQTSWNFRNF